MQQIEHRKALLTILRILVLDRIQDAILYCPAEERALQLKLACGRIALRVNRDWNKKQKTEQY
jgi:hypothetical protein